MNTDLSRVGPVERDIELAKTALKKGTNLLKYGRRGKPKFCPFRLSNDESLLVWYSGNEEKHLRLSHVSRIIPGQRTPIFQRCPRPEKEYQSFSLIYNNRSLDLICKDKDEAEVWFTGLKALISRYHRRGKTDPRSGVSSEASSPKAQTQHSSPLSSPFGSCDSLQKDGADPIYTPFESPQKNGLEKALSNVNLYTMPAKTFIPQGSTSSVQSFSSGGFDVLNGRSRGAGVDTFRVSLSSAVSSSSHGSGHDDGDALGDVYIWGEGTGEAILGGGAYKLGSSLGAKLDSYKPKTLDSAVLLDVQNVACGGKHAALVTKQGEVFTWGEDSGGRLGHGVDSDVSHPKLLDALKNINIELVACGENHSCAVSLSGDLYIWGGKKYSFGLPGQGDEMGNWIPKRLIGPLEGIHVAWISCGPWHTAVVSSAGQLFTFGDGTFGVLGHGDRKSSSVPREVESLKGLRTVRAACGVWHTAAVVEVMVGSSSASNCSSGKLFTWGDGDKGRLGHGDKEARLVPTCVAALVEPNFCQVVCGHSLTVALTTIGQVYTMGSPVYGQLGNPQVDGKLPVRVDGRLVNSFVEEISCGAYHVAVLTSRTEVYTWGKGANGRLGHGDTDDKNCPTLVEALKDKQVKSVACGTNFTAAICLHKWVSGADQSLCSGCRLAFNFKRKRHNCYNCGLVFCHPCSSRKSLKASMAPNPNKPYRVCDNCYNKLRKSTDDNSSSQTSLSRRGSMNQRSNQNTEGDDGKVSMMETFKDIESVSSKRSKKSEFNSSRVTPFPNGFTQWGTFNTSKYGNSAFGSSKKFFSASLPGSRIVSRATSPTSRRSSPPRASTPGATLKGLTSPKKVVDDAKSTNDHLSQEVLKLRAQVGELTRKTQFQEVELEKTSKQLKEAIAIAGEETAKCKAAKEVIKSLTAQLKEMAERLPLGAVRNSKVHIPGSPGLSPSSDGSSVKERLSSPVSVHELGLNGSNRIDISNGQTAAVSNNTTGIGHLDTPTRNKSKISDVEGNCGSEWVEQDEPGVYITLVSLPGGIKDLKRVRFSRKRFSEKEAEQWWATNRDRVYQQYDVPMVDKAGIGVGKDGILH
ncbi:hypothetical protein RND81_10G059700 [Saponaria officinalis]|uniref:Uncharacterized protein n=1 Tax=Saponaria officinalis TaxID=3572 RepID=A0AAW1HYG9_SAPOF